MTSLDNSPSSACVEAEVVAEAKMPEAGRGKGTRKSVTLAASTSRRAIRDLVAEHAALEPDLELLDRIRPQTRADCVNGVRPCPFISCRHHLFLDVSEQTGSIKLNFPDKEVWELEESCVLDVADRGGATLEEVARAMNLTRERARQLESKSIHHASRGGCFDAGDVV